MFPLISKFPGNAEVASGPSPTPCDNVILLFNVKLTDCNLLTVLVAATAPVPKAVSAP